LITLVVLCGGSGTRLWPLSCKTFPKQLVPLISNKSLLKLTLERVYLLSKTVICVTSDEHRFLVAKVMQASKAQGTILLEPVARNTAAAMTIAALAAKPKDLLLFCPSDHHIPDAAAFARVVSKLLTRRKQVPSSPSVYCPPSPAPPTALFAKAAPGQTAPSTLLALQKNQLKTRQRNCCSQARHFGVCRDGCPRPG